MQTRSFPRDLALAWLVIVPAGLGLGCGGGTDLAEPELGTLEISTVTSGPEPDADGYSVTIDGGDAEPIGPTATLRHTGVPVGPHTVELSGAAENCDVADEGRLSVSVTANATATASFTVTCRPTTGAIEVTTSIGSPSDPNGYTLLLDGSEPQPIGTSGTVTLLAIAPGAHTIGLGGVADNCEIQGDNPRSVTVTAGDTAVVAIAVTCAEPPPPPGTIRITTATDGVEQDPDGYTVTLDGGAGQPIGTGATLSVPDLTPGQHSVELGGVAANCAVAAGDNPRSVTVPSGDTADVSFAVACSATTGSLAVTISGLPDGIEAAVTVTGPESFSEALIFIRTLGDLAPGSYTVAAANVTAGESSYAPSPASQTASVAAGSTATATVAYSQIITPSLDLRIDGAQLTQSTQDSDGKVPLVQGRDAYLRVFALANESNSATPNVRVRLFRDGTLTATLSIAAAGASTPTARDDGTLASSWNLKISGALIQQGLAVLADVDPGNDIAEKDETDNSFPLSGTPRPVDVEAAGTLGLRFVPVKQRANDLQGDVSDANKDRYLDLLTRLYPLPGTDADVHAVYTTTTTNPLQPENANGAWGTVLSELDALRVTEGTARNYYGVVNPGYRFGIVGLAFLGRPTAMGWDDLLDASRVLAHELGHNWERLHAPCGNPGSLDPSYPYPDGRIGVYGLDASTALLKSPSTPDVMGYCSDPWISDYNYKAVFAYRSAHPVAAVAFGREQPCLLVWGRIVDGRPALEPAFQVVTKPRLPSRAGPYAVEGLSADGGRVFSISFDATAAADDPRETRIFAFAVPLDDARAARLESLRLYAPAGEVVATPVAAARVGPAAADSVIAQRAGDGVALRWDAAVHPMIMVRDAETGEVLSFARGGEARIATGRTALDLVVSDRVRSERKRVSLSGR